MTDDRISITIEEVVHFDASNTRMADRPAVVCRMRDEADVRLSLRLLNLLGDGRPRLVTATNWMPVVTNSGATFAAHMFNEVRKVVCEVINRGE